MSLFLPSNLSPNFEEIIDNSKEIDFKFQVNTNGSLVRAYKLEILNDKNDANTPEDNILATFYGNFDSPLYNKQVYTLSLEKTEIEKKVTLVTSKDYRWRIRLYEDEINFTVEDESNSTAEDKIKYIKHECGNTYVGGGNVVGTTKNVIWLNKIDNSVVVDKYVQMTLRSDSDTNDFNPFNVRLTEDKQKGGIQTTINIDKLEDGSQIKNGLRYNARDQITGIVVDMEEILPEYKKKISDGNMYILLDNISNSFDTAPGYDTNGLPKLITGFISLPSESYEQYHILEIDERQAYFVYENEGVKNDTDIESYTLMYIQRQQIYSIDRSVGKHALTKITVDKPFDYSVFHGEQVEIDLVNDDFDYNRVYIEPIKEFDSKLVPSAYINMAYTMDQLIDTSGSEQYSRLLEQPEDWEENCEYYFSANMNTYQKVQKTYNLILNEEAPQGWSSGVYRQYYERIREYEKIKDDVAPVFISNRFYRYDSADGGYHQVVQKPNNWNENAYRQYYRVVYKYRLLDYDQAPSYQIGMYYRYGAPQFYPGSYYSYGISKKQIANYTESLACMQLTNYVASTGECSLFSDLQFMPCKFYMYQVFVPDTSAPNYDITKGDIPYKYYAGTYTDHPDYVVKTDKCYYLGGGSKCSSVGEAQYVIDLNGDGVFDYKDIDLNGDKFIYGALDYLDLEALKKQTNFAINAHMYDYDQNGVVSYYEDFSALRQFCSEYTGCLLQKPYDWQESYSSYKIKNQDYYDKIVDEEDKTYGYKRNLGILLRMESSPSYMFESTGHTEINVNNLTRDGKYEYVCNLIDGDVDNRELPLDWEYNYWQYYTDFQGEYRQVWLRFDYPKWESEKYYSYNGSDLGYVLTKSKPEDWEWNCESYSVHIDNKTEIIPIYVSYTCPQWEPGKYYWYNEESKTFSIVDSKPDDWNTTYKSYYIREEVTSADDEIQVPGLKIIPKWESGKYYERQGDESNAVYTAIDEEPSNWNTWEVTNYYIVDETDSDGNTTYKNVLYETIAPEWLLGIYYRTKEEKYNDDTLTKEEHFANFLKDNRLGNGIAKVISYDLDQPYKTATIYSNHQIGADNQYMCFIQPNLGIYEDQYKPCMLQLYNNKYQNDIYITNYNGLNTYNKNYSIDTLDDSQWLVTLTYPDKDFEDEAKKNELLELIKKPQTKYKIYTNFANSMPEAYFYYRSDKTLSFNYYDFYSKEPARIYNDGVRTISVRDVIVQCDIHDVNTNSNLVPIKLYKYVIYEGDTSDKIIYESQDLYDGQFQCVIRGSDNCYEPGTTDMKSNPTEYTIQIIAVDEYGQAYQHSEHVRFGYSQEIDNDRISATIDCEKQAVHIKFSPVKTFGGVGRISPSINNSYITVKDDAGLEFNSLHDDAGNTIRIPEVFKFYTKLRINEDMFNISEEQSVFQICTDSGVEYKVTFDTRVYILDNGTGKYTINNDYLYFKLYKNNDEVENCKIPLENLDSSFSVNNSFYYAIWPQKPDSKGVYFLEKSTENASVDSLQISEDLIDNGNYKVFQENIQRETLFIYDDDDNDINASYKKLDMPFLYFTIETASDNDIRFIISQDNNVNNQGRE